MTTVRLSTTLAALAVALAVPATSGATPFDTAAPPVEAAGPPVDTAGKTDADVDIADPAEIVVSAEWAGPTDWAALEWRPGRVPAPRSARPWTVPAPGFTPATRWSRTEAADGSAAVTVERALPLGWDSKVGADLNVTAPSSPGPVDPNALLPGATATPSPGAAWASVTTPALDLPLGFDKAAIDARLDPAQELGKLGVSASKLMALGGPWSLTLQGGLAVTDTLAAPAAPGLSNALGGALFQTTEQVARLTILPIQTAIAAGRIASAADPRWFHTLSAEQRLFDGASVVGSVSETPEGPLNTSILAKFQRRW